MGRIRFIHILLSFTSIIVCFYFLSVKTNFPWWVNLVLSQLIPFLTFIFFIVVGHFLGKVMMRIFSKGDG